jgi:hypothetical protein
MRVALAVILGVLGIAWGANALTEHMRLERLAAERDIAAEQNRLNFLEFERQQRAIPVGRPMGKPLPGQRDA